MRDMFPAHVAEALLRGEQLPPEPKEMVGLSPSLPLSPCLLLSRSSLCPCVPVSLCLCVSVCLYLSLSLSLSLFYTALLPSPLSFPFISLP
jgi:hypothetical protein